MAYRNKTYVAFASEDIKYYRVMEAWRDNDNIDFSFLDAHDLYESRDTSLPGTIKRNLRERMKNAKQVVLLGSATAKKKGSNGTSFLAYEVDVMLEFGLPIVVANLDRSQTVDRNFIPKPILEADYYTVSVAFRMKMIQHALDEYVEAFKRGGRSGPHQYPKTVYDNLGL